MCYNITVLIHIVQLLQKGAIMFQIDPLSRTPVYEQIVLQVEKLISAGILSPGDQLPSVRSLSLELSVNPNTIQRSYGTLDTLGIVVSVPGRGCFISDSAADTLLSKSKKRLGEISALASELFSAGISRNDILTSVQNGIDSAAAQSLTDKSGGNS